MTVGSVGKRLWTDAARRAGGSSLRPTRQEITPVSCQCTTSTQRRKLKVPLNQRRHLKALTATNVSPACTECSYRPRLRCLAHVLARWLVSAHLLLAHGLPDEQRVLVGLGQHQAVERVLVRAQRVDRGTAVVDDAVQQAELRRGPPHVAHADVHADVRQAALPPAVTQPVLQLLGAGLGVTVEGRKGRF